MRHGRQVSARAVSAAGVAWARGYADGDRLPPKVLAAEVAAIARVIGIPLTVDIEGGYADTGRGVAETIAAIVDAGAVGINIEDGAGPPDLLCVKIAAAKEAASRRGIDLFVNARTDVCLRRLVPADSIVEAVLSRAERYRAAGCDSLFVPALSDAALIAEVAAKIDPLPLNLMVVPGLPAAGVLRRIGVRRLSAGAAISQAALGLTQRLAKSFLATGSSDELLRESPIAYPAMNALFT